MEDQHRQIKQLAPRAAVKPARALVGAITRDTRIGAAQLAAPRARSWRRAGRYGVAG